MSARVRTLAREVGASSVKVRVNQTLRGAPAEIILSLKRDGYFRTTSQAINEAVVHLADAYAERKLKHQCLKTQEESQDE